VGTVRGVGGVGGVGSEGSMGRDVREDVDREAAVCLAWKGVLQLGAEIEWPTNRRKPLRDLIRR
jgi:hypothetical protein